MTINRILNITTILSTTMPKSKDPTPWNKKNGPVPESIQAFLRDKTRVKLAQTNWSNKHYHSFKKDGSLDRARTARKISNRRGNLRREARQRIDQARIRLDFSFNGKQYPPFVDYLENLEGVCSSRVAKSNDPYKIIAALQKDYRKVQEYPSKVRKICRTNRLPVPHWAQTSNSIPNLRMRAGTNRELEDKMRFINTKCIVLLQGTEDRLSPAEADLYNRIQGSMETGIKVEDNEIPMSFSSSDTFEN